VVQRRRKQAKRPSPASRSSRTGVSRREYAELVLRLGSVELQVQRNRAEIELHTQRIAHLQDTIEALKTTSAAVLSTDIAALPAPPTGTIES
jgi:hypothetical protein